MWFIYVSSFLNIVLMIRQCKFLWLELTTSLRLLSSLLECGPQISSDKTSDTLSMRVSLANHLYGEEVLNYSKKKTYRGRRKPPSCYMFLVIFN